MEWIIFIFLFAVSHAVVDLLSKNILKTIDPLTFSFYRFLGSFILQICISPFLNLQIDWTSLGLIYIISIIASIAFYYRSKAIQKLELSSALTLLNITPLFLLILAVVLLGESLTIQKVLGILLIVLPLFIIRRNLGKNNLHLPLITAGIFAIAITLDKVVLTRIDPLTFTFYITAFFTLNLGIATVIKQKKIPMKNLITHKFKYMIIGLTLYISQFSQYFAKALVEVSIVSPILFAMSLIPIIISKKVFKDTHVVNKIFATILMIAGVFLLSIQ